jgi:MFS family permease
MLGRCCSSVALHPVVRRAVRLLGGSFALAWVTISMSAGPGPSAYVRLSGSLGDAGYYFALYALLAAAGAGSGGWLMDRFGRRPVLIAAHLTMAVGFTLAGLAVMSASLALFALGVAALAFGAGAVYLTRLAAAELFPPALRGRGMAWVLVSATAGAIMGPLLLIASEPLGQLLGRDPNSLVWFLAPPLLLAGAALVALAPEPRAIAQDLARYHPDAPPMVVQERGPAPAGLAATAVIALALAAAAMVTAMGIAGPAVEQHGHSLAATGAVLAFHFVGMFALSTYVGRVADRAGRRRTILAGLGILALGGALMGLLQSIEGLAVGLLLIGLGWSFAYTGASVLLTDITPMARRARVLGRADLVASLCQAVLSSAGGWWFAQRGLAGIALAVMAVVAVPLVLVARVREPKPGAYEGAMAAA